MSSKALPGSELITSVSDPVCCPASVQCAAVREFRRCFLDQHAESSAVCCVCSAPVVGFKAVPSGDVATNAWSKKDKTPEEIAAKALASGRYTMYQVI
jgi:hypothetical protein